MNAGTTRRTDFIPYPTNRVVGTVGDAGNARAAIDALLEAGFPREAIDILNGEEDFQRLDPAGVEHHGFLAQFQRTLLLTFELEEFQHLLEDVRAGRFVIMVLAKRRAQRMLAADILNRYGAAFVGFYGRWAWEGLPATAQTSPEDIPAGFARAWNARDADALASLFDEDAEFVNVAGVCWHDRESIRKAHANGLEPIFNTSTLLTDATTVKRLSPEIAVVHARMTLSSQAPASAVTQPGPRTTIVSFVVHRMGDRWRCASAQHTDVIPVMTADVIAEAGVPFGELSDGQVS